MPPVIHDRVPLNFPAGTTVRYTREFDDFLPSDGWGYTIYLNGLTQKFSKAASVSSNAFQILFEPSDTASLPPGPYRFAERLTKPQTVLVLTGVTIDGEGNAIYAFSSFTGPAPLQQAIVDIAGFSNAGNNISGEITEVTAGTITLVNAGAVVETIGATATIPEEIHDERGDELVITIEPNAASSAAGTFNTADEQMLVVVEAALQGRLTADIQAYQIAGRSVSKIPIAELRCIRGELRAAIWRQQHPGKLGVPFKVQFPLEAEGADYPPTWVDVTGLDR